jgi:hypothetical protein
LCSVFGLLTNVMLNCPNALRVHTWCPHFPWNRLTLKFFAKYAYKALLNDWQGICKGCIYVNVDVFLACMLRAALSLMSFHIASFMTQWCTWFVATWHLMLFTFVLFCFSVSIHT